MQMADEGIGEDGRRYRKSTQQEDQLNIKLTKEQRTLAALHRSVDQNRALESEAQSRGLENPLSKPTSILGSSLILHSNNMQ